MGEEFKVGGNIGELRPGTTPRRFEPEGGIGKLKSKIHRESRYADEHKNLPFKFSKPRKPGRKKVVECSKCGSITQVGVNAVGIICGECKQYASVKEVSEND